MNEIWKGAKVFFKGELLDYSDLYEVSNFGQIRSVDRVVKSGIRNVRKQGCILKQRRNNRGYPMVNLWRENEMRHVLVHRIVATTFIDKPNDKDEIDHIIPLSNGGTNHVENLQWVTKQENRNNKYTIKNTRGKNDKRSKPVIGINKLTGESIKFDGLREVERELSAGHSNVSRCCEHNKNVNNKPRYVKGYYWYWSEDYARKGEINHGK